jgi:hypothetical protein
MLPIVVVAQVASKVVSGSDTTSAMSRDRDHIGRVFHRLFTTSLKNI